MLWGLSGSEELRRERSCKFFTRAGVCKSHQLNTCATRERYSGKGRAIKDGQTLLQLASEGGQLALSVAAIGSQIAPHGSIVPEKFLDALPTLAPHVAQALGSARLIAERLATIQPNSLPRPYRESFEEIRRTIAPLPNQLVSLQRLLEILIPSLGIDAKKRYLFVFQNNTELRPTGGFIGSFALVDIDRGRISKSRCPAAGHMIFPARSMSG